MSEPSEAEVRKVISTAAASLSVDWRQLASRLGLGIDDINSIIAYNTTRKEKCKAVLERALIMDRKGVDYLKKQLRSMGRQDVINLIEEIKGILNII